MSEWQPIESAPKDGTQIIGQWPSYDKNYGPHVGPIAWERKWYMLGHKVWEGWWCVGGGLPNKEPTHWQPYPAPLAVEFPKHKASLHLFHNDHLSSYQTVEQSIRDGDHGYNDDDWVSEEQKQKAIATNDCWMLQWYTETPVGFCLMSAADLDVLLAAACAAT